jgi:hypothetical protein
MSAYIAPAKTTDHGTPAEVWECVRRTFRCRAVDLDPAASKRHRMIQARRQFFGPDVDGIDGATQDWRGRVYNNPPYAREVPRFVTQARAETEAGRARGVIQLLPFRAANWFLDDILGGASMICPIRGRLVFLGSIDPYPVDSLAVLWGDEFRDSFAQFFGAYVPKAQVLRSESAKAAKAAGRKRRRTWWVQLTRPLGVVVDLKAARRGKEALPWAFAS